MSLCNLISNGKKDFECRSLLARKDTVFIRELRNIGYSEMLIVLKLPLKYSFPDAFKVISTDVICNQVSISTGYIWVYSISSQLVFYLHKQHKH